MPDISLVSWPAPERNKEPILRVLEPLFKEGLVLELASGTGQHAVHFAAGLPGVVWQPSDADPELCEVIALRVAQAALPNLRPPLLLDVASPVWPITKADGLFCANLLHISHYQVTQALFAGAARVLAPGSLLVTYGPYRRGGQHTSVSNADFDAALKAQDPTWGVRDVDDLVVCASERGLELLDTIQMPANNLSLVWKKR